MQPAAPTQDITGTAPASTVKADPALLNEIEALRSQARQSIADNKISEGIKLYISAMLRARTSYPEIFTNLNMEIAAISARLSLEPHEDWLGPGGEQISASTREILSAKSIMPSVYLYENYGFGKAAIPDAAIRFEFIENNGTLVQTVTTDSFGMANTTISSIESSGRNAHIRAYPVFSNEGFSYAFKELYRDFVYLAPRTHILVAGMEKTPTGSGTAPRSMDAAAQSIRDLDFDVSVLGTTPEDRSFSLAMNGNKEAIAILNKDGEAGYIALLLLEIDAPTQLVVQGVSYNIFNTNGRMTLRIIRTDGTVVYTLLKDKVRGQGGNTAAAIDDCRLKLQNEITNMIRDNNSVIREAFLD
ncbi:MAG: hypothetical protein KKI09_00055 [Spirochaetes bacterium]|nr:hypothetical protein [Spirochaetota bacterium]MBU0953789.1 hypothetical protein [Spirochaetota bacterium]